MKCNAARTELCEAGPCINVAPDVYRQRPTESTTTRGAIGKRSRNYDLYIMLRMKKKK